MRTNIEGLVGMNMQKRGVAAQRMREQLKSAYDDRGRPIKSYWDNLYIQNSLNRMGDNYNESDFIQGYKPIGKSSSNSPSFEEAGSERDDDYDNMSQKDFVNKYRIGGSGGTMPSQGFGRADKERDRQAFAAAIKRYPNAKISYGNGVIENNPNNTKVNKKSNINY